MPVDPVGETGIALRIGRGHIVDADRRSVGEDNPLPHDERAALPERDVAIVAADQPRALRDQQRPPRHTIRSEEHTSELQSLMRISYAVFCLKKKKKPSYSH